MRAIVVGRRRGWRAGTARRLGGACLRQSRRHRCRSLPADGDPVGREQQQGRRDGQPVLPLAIGADRLDYSKGLPQRFEAYARLLERHPEHRRCVQFRQICPSSREEVDEYRRLRLELERLTEEINRRFAQHGWTPLLHSSRAVPRETLAGLFRTARVGVVTPLHDGMNLVAKEYVAAQPDEDPGVLILSRSAGAARELTDALIVDPSDADAIADAMHVALAMPASIRAGNSIVSCWRAAC